MTRLATILSLGVVLLSLGMAAPRAAAQDPITALMSGASEGQRLAAVRQIRERTLRGAIDELGHALGHDASPLVRAACAELLGLWGVRGARALLVLAETDDPSPDVRRAATAALARMPPRRDEPVDCLPPPGSGHRMYVCSDGVIRYWSD